jgi:DNA-binding NarL/FixJ family response regulator
MENRKSILLIDRDIATLDLCNCFLKEFYKNVSHTDCSQNGLDLLKKYKYDLVIIESRMPTIDGYDFIETGKQLSPNTHFIIMSEEVSVLLLHRAIKVGVFDYLEKPFSRTTIVEKVDSAFHHKSHQHQNTTLKNIIHEINEEKSIEKKSLLLEIKDEISEVLKKSNGNLEVAKFDIENILDSKIHSDDTGLINFLTPTERKISDMLNAGFSARTISRKTDRSLNTIQVHIRSIRKKLGLVKHDKNLANSMDG